MDEFEKFMEKTAANVSYINNLVNKIRNAGKKVQPKKTMLQKAKEGIKSIKPGSVAKGLGAAASVAALGTVGKKIYQNKKDLDYLKEHLSRFGKKGLRTTGEL